MILKPLAKEYAIREYFRCDQLVDSDNIFIGHFNCRTREDSWSISDVHKMILFDSIRKSINTDYFTSHRDEYSEV